MRTLKVLRLLLDTARPPDTLNGHLLVGEQKEWVAIGFASAKKQANSLISLLEEEEQE